MKKLILIAALLLPMLSWSAQQPILPNRFTTNTDANAAAQAAVQVYANGNSVATVMTNPANSFVASNMTTVNFANGISPMAFGATGNGDVFTNIAMTSGSRTLTIVGGGQKYGAGLSQSDVGKAVLVYGAGFVTSGTTNCLSSIITNVSSSTVCTLSNAALNTCGGTKVFAVYGTDDTVALQAWLNYSTNFFNNAGTNDAMMDVPDKIFVVAGPVIDPWSSNIYVLHTNSQLYLPSYPIVGDYTKTIEIHGHNEPAPHEQGPGVSTLGSIFWSFYVNTNSSLPYVGSSLLRNVTHPAILTSQCWLNSIFNASGIDGYTNRFNAVRMRLKNLTFRAGANPSISGIDLSGCVNAEVSGVMGNTGVRWDNGWEPKNTNVFALKMPTTFCDNNNIIESFQAEGFDVGIELGEHLHIKSCTIEGCKVAFVCRNMGHWCVIDNADPEGCPTVFYSTGQANGMIANITIEGSNPIGANTWYNPVTIINDWNNGMYGQVSVDDTSSIGAWDSSVSNVVSKIGGAHVKLVRYTVIGSVQPVDVYEQNEVHHGQFTVLSNLVANVVVATNVEPDTLSSILISRPAEATPARFSFKTGPTAYLTLEKNQSTGNSTYDNCFNFNLIDQFGQRTLGTITTNGIWHFLGGACSGGDASGNNPLLAPYGLNALTRSFFTNDLLNAATLVLEPNGAIRASSTAGGSGYNILSFDSPNAEPQLKSGGSGYVFLSRDSGLGQKFYGNGILWGTGLSDGLHTSTNYTSAEYVGTLTVTNTITGNSYATFRNITISGNTNVAPAGYTVAVTAPVCWLSITNAGNVYLVPAYAP